MFNYLAFLISSAPFSGRFNLLMLLPWFQLVGTRMPYFKVQVFIWGLWSTNWLVFFIQYTPVFSYSNNCWIVVQGV